MAALHNDQLGKIAPALLDWYDENARALPWRVGPAERARGVAPDPYRVWLSEVMLQQTTVATVTPRYQRFLDRWPDVAALAAAPLDDVLGEWAGLGYYARARNLHACASAVAARADAQFPETVAELRALPGVGEYTGAAVAAIAFDVATPVVDGNVERVTARLFAIDAAGGAFKKAVRAAADAMWPDARSGDFAQALMDLGAGPCRPRTPNCGACPLTDFCAARARGTAGELPHKAAKAKKPERVGAAFALFDASGRGLLERRPSDGLLGGMLGLPGTAWSEGAPSVDEALASAPARAEWRLAGAVSHVFTHFRLRLDVHLASTSARTATLADAIWLDPEEARLPTVMRKAVACATGARDDLFAVR
ncbi:MAG: A/G-specific adenine glycosylase [Pseudomonadota bacterium]